MAKVTGIGGVFLKSRDHRALKDWYGKYLGMNFEDWGGAILDWKEDQQRTKGDAITVWHLADHDGDWFAPSTAQCMINYRVDDLDGIVARFAADGVQPVKGPDQEDNGRFVWFMDPEGNKVELWEPA